MIVLAAVRPDAETAELGRALRGLDEVAVLAPARPRTAEESIAFVRADLSTAEGAQTALARAEEGRGPATCIVTAPAQALSTPLLALTDDVWSSTLASNTTAAMHVARAAARRMGARGTGRIVLVGWRIDRRAGAAHLAATSGTIAQLARSLAAEVGPSGVTVNAVLVPPSRLSDAAGAVRLIRSLDAGYLTAEVLLPGRSDPAAEGWQRPAGLAGRVAMITGAGQGIGAEIAVRMASEGAQVAVNSLHVDKAEATAARARSTGATAEAFPADVADADDVDELVRLVEAKLGAVDVLVNNAAVLSMAPLSEMDLAEWHRQIAVNLTGPMRVSRRVVPGMIDAGHGRILNVSSIWGLAGASGATAYAAAKGGLNELTRAMAEELGPKGVRVTGIAPGVVSTPQLAADAAFAGITIPEMERQYALETLVGRIATSQEIAGLVAFLASDAGTPFEGQTIAVTGGRSG